MLASRVVRGITRNTRDKTSLIPPEQIEQLILLIRRQRVMLDRDLAGLRQVTNVFPAKRAGQPKPEQEVLIQRNAKQADGTRRMVGGCVKQQKIWPQLRHRTRVTAEHETDPDVSGMTAVAAEHGTYLPRAFTS
jgi:hypothetical protein